MSIAARPPSVIVTRHMITTRMLQKQPKVPM